MTLLKVEGLTKRFGGLVAVNKVDFEVKIHSGPMCKSAWEMAICLG